MSENWQVAKVIHLSVPEAGWGLAEITTEKRVIFFRAARAVAFTLRGMELIPSQAMPEELDIPVVGSEIAICGLIAPDRGGKYHQAVQWTTWDHLKAMGARADKAETTLAEIAEESRRKAAEKQELAERIARRINGSGGKKKGGKKAAAVA